MTIETAQRTGRRARGPARRLSDERLVRRAALGDEGALEEVCVRYRQDLYRFCLTMLADPHDAQDAVQNALVKVVQALPGERRPITLKPWLYRIARNESIELVRRRPAIADAPEPAGSVDIAETAEARERLRTLLEDLGDLPERQRATLMMRELGGLGFDEIAAVVDTSEGAVRQSIYEARQTLRRMEGGHAMSCEAVQRALSDADGRVARRRELRSHLRGCEDCRSFRDSIAHRRGDLAAISPLPAVASAALLQSALGGGGAAAGAGAGGATAGAAAAGAAAKSAGVAGLAAGGIVAKSTATVAIVAVVGVSAADRVGVVDVPMPGERTTVERQATPGNGGGETSPGAAAGAVGGAAAGDSNGDSGEASRSGGTGRSERPEAASEPAKATSGPGQAAKGGSRDHGSGKGSSPGGPAQEGHPPRRGPPASMPSASAGGQENAATRKSPNSNGAPGGAEPSKGAGGSSTPGSQAKQPAPPSQKVLPAKPEATQQQTAPGAAAEAGSIERPAPPETP